MINLKSIYGQDAAVKPSNSEGGYKNMIPPTITLADGTIQITDFVKGVTIKSYVYDAVKDQAVITFEKDGATVRKYLGNPLTDKRITGQADPVKKANMLMWGYREFTNIVNQFVYKNAVERKIDEAGDMEFPAYVTLLGQILESGEDRINQEVWLKLVFRESTGAKPVYDVGRNTYIGNEGFTPKWTENGNQWDDIRNFALIEKTPDYSSDGATNASDADDIFGGNEDLELL